MDSLFFSKGSFFYAWSTTSEGLFESRAFSVSLY
jgi:hypothetical protein